MKDGYNTNCGKCHATCGDCHVNRPKAGGGGLYQAHNFSKLQTWLTIVQLVTQVVEDMHILV